MKIFLNGKIYLTLVIIQKIQSFLIILIKKVIGNVCISNLTLKSDIGSLTGKNVEEHLTALQLDITDNSTTSNVGLPLLPFAYNFNDLNEIRIKIG